MVYFKENYKTHRTCDFPGGGGPPFPALDRHMTFIGPPNWRTLIRYRHSGCKKYFLCLMLNISRVKKKQTRARSRWGAIANPHAKVFDSLSTPQSHPRAWPWQKNENSVQYVFCLLFVRTYTNFGIKIFEIDMLMIFDLLTWPQGHQFDPWMKILLAFCSAGHPRRFDIPHDHVWKKKFFDALGTPSVPKSHPWGMTQGTEWKSRLICFVSFICENTHKVWYKNLWNWLCNWN